MSDSSDPKLNGMIISDTSIRQPVFVTMLMLLTIVIGLLSYFSLPVNLFPDFSVPVVVVSVPYPGAGPESVAEQVARPLEDSINTINGVKHITSSSSEGFAAVVVEFETGVDPIRAEQDVREKVNGVRPRLPRDVRDPIFQRFDPNELPVLSLAITSEEGQSPLELRNLIDDAIVPRLQRIQGVGSVAARGGQIRQINVQMDLRKLKAWQVLPVQITRALQTANANLGLGTMNAGAQDISLRVPSMLQTPEDIARIQITGTPYRIGDVATVEDGTAEVNQYARLDGKDAITIDVRKQSGANTVTVADEVKAELEVLAKEYPALHYFIPQDQSTFVKESTNGAIEELFVASIAAMLVVLLFFRDFRNTLVTVAGLPVILIGTFAALQAFGLSINVISLMGLSLSVGLVIDDAIVVRENIFRHMERGETPMVASSRGTAEVAMSVLAMSLTIIAVFLPVAFTGGVTGIIFKSFGITVACAMAISLIEAFTLAPMLSAYFFKQKTAAGQHAPQESSQLPDEARESLGRLAQFYERLLAWSLRHRLAITGIALVFLFLSGVVAYQLKFSFFPPQDPGEFSVGFELPPGTPLSETDRLARQAEAIMLQDPAVEAVLATIGGGGGGGFVLAGGGQPEKGEFFVKLHEGQATSPIQERLRPQLSFLPTLVFSQASFQGSSTAVSSRQLQLSIQTSRPVEELIPLVQEFQGQAQGVVGLADIDTTFKPGKPELRFHVDPSKVGDLGITNDDIASSVRALINGDRATVLRQGGEDVDVVVRLQPGDRANVEDIRSISIPTRGGNVALDSLVDVEVAASPTVIRRYDRLNQILIGANVVGRNANEVQAEIEAGLAQMDIPPDVTISFVGQAEMLNEGFTSLYIAMFLSVLFVYMVLASQFGSFLQPFVIMLAMPFSFIGAFLALLITRLDLDIIGMIGLIMLLGLVTKNSILLVDFTNQLRHAGMEKHKAISRAGAIRLRPILMTTTALVAGSIPVAIGLGEGSEIRRGLSIVLIGGLLTSMLLTLLVIPTAYSLLESFTQRATRLFRRQQQPIAPSEAPHSQRDLHSGTGRALEPVNKETTT